MDIKTKERHIRRGILAVGMLGCTFGIVIFCSLGSLSRIFGAKWEIAIMLFGLTFCAIGAFLIYSVNFFDRVHAEKEE